MRLGLLAAVLIAVGCGLVPGVGLRAVAEVRVSATRSDATLRCWAGSYVYEDALGETPPGSGARAFISYTLHIPGSESQPVTLRADGFQTQDRLRCSIVGDAARIEVRFVSFADGSAKNQFGVAVYQPNEVLFTLQRTKEGLLTEWKALKPDGVSSRRVPYFLLLPDPKVQAATA